MTELKLPSDRSFGQLFAVVSALLGAWLWWKATTYWWAAFVAAAIFLTLSFAAPAILHPLNIAWMRLGALLNRIVSPIVMGAIYFGLFTPMAVVMRLRGRDSLARSLDAKASSYWVERAPPGPDARRSFPRQF